MAYVYMNDEMRSTLDRLYLDTMGWKNHDDRIKGVQGESKVVKFKFLGLDCELSVRRHDYTERSKKARMYVGYRDESVLEHLNNRMNRPVGIYREIVKVGLDKAGIIDFGKIRWSQYAGCSCPCSPGFIIDGIGGYDLWIDVVGGGDKDQLTKEDQNAPARLALI